MTDNEKRELASEKDDQKVIEAQNGDKDAQEFILRKYKNLVKSHAKQYHITGADKEDLIQEGMIGLYKAIRDYNPEKNTYFHVFAQLCIARQIMSAVKSANRKKHTPLNDYISLDVSAEDVSENLIEQFSVNAVKGPEQLLIEKEDSENMRKKLQKALTEKEIKIVDLYLKGYSYAEMAEIVGISDKGISSTLHRVKKKLNAKVQPQADLGDENE